MNRLALAVVAVIVAAGAAWLVGRAPAAPSGPADQPRTFQGSGILKTEAFHLRGGSYRLHWEARTPADLSECPHTVALADARTDRQRDVLVMVRPQAPGGQGESAAHGIPAGDYYLNVASACAWSLTLAPAAS